MQTIVDLSFAQDIATLTFVTDPPGKPATVDYAVLDQMDAALDEVEHRLEELTALIVRSASERYFIVGANIRALETLDAKSIVDWVKRGHAVFNRLEALSLPVLAVVTGFALGGGLELAMACDLIVAGENAKFGQPEANLGLVAGWGATYRLPRRIGPARAKELFFTGRIIDAETAFRYGLINFVGSEKVIEAEIIKLCDEMRPLSSLAIGEMKGLVNDQSISLADAGEAEASASTRCLASEDSQRRVAEFLDSRRK